MNELTVYSIVPNAERLLELAPEEVAGVILEVLNSLALGNGFLNRYTFTRLGGMPSAFQEQDRQRVSEALMEGWVWLEREGLIAPRPGEQGDWIFVTRRGKQVAGREGLESYRRGSLLPAAQLHPLIVINVRASFLRGHYDTAVFEAFREVEVAVRKGGSFTDQDYGADLMRKAFSPDRGPLTSRTAPKSEREALANLFAGAIGSYKNPTSHRHVNVSAEEAVEMIVLASHLLGIVDSRISSIK